VGVAPPDVEDEVVVDVDVAWDVELVEPPVAFPELEPHATRPAAPPSIMAAVTTHVVLELISQSLSRWRRLALRARPRRKPRAGRSDDNPIASTNDG
jgi:hypothetical protein